MSNTDPIAKLDLLITELEGLPPPPTITPVIDDLQSQVDPFLNELALTIKDTVVKKEVYLLGQHRMHFWHRNYMEILDTEKPYVVVTAFIGGRTKKEDTDAAIKIVAEAFNRVVDAGVVVSSLSNFIGMKLPPPIEYFGGMVKGEYRTGPPLKNDYAVFALIHVLEEDLPKLKELTPYAGFASGQLIPELDLGGKENET